MRHAHTLFSGLAACLSGLICLATADMARAQSPGPAEPDLVGIHSSLLPTRMQREIAGQPFRRLELRLGANPDYRRPRVTPNENDQATWADPAAPFGICRVTPVVEIGGGFRARFEEMCDDPSNSGSIAYPEPVYCWAIYPPAQPPYPGDVSLWLQVAFQDGFRFGRQRNLGLMEIDIPVSEMESRAGLEMRPCERNSHPAGEGRRKPDTLVAFVWPLQELDRW
ncbi:hypothetical protein [Brevundimonas sp.]|uniref:hypothetical protein n=3 Tax=Brevundimonas sp. TaxID=1871086 RepID=UPI00273737F7|nr:hypothetical protein [Brevundimonas sp.]